MKYRIESDFLGELKIPSEAYYGIHTQRAIDNFPIAEVAISVYPNIVIAYAMVKLACARANNQLGLLDDDIYHPIVAACERIINGEFHDQFVVEIIQGGAGTSTNMNANEVIANVALEIIGKEKGDYDTISPLDHVNMSQSTNDTYPTALLVGFLKEFVEDYPDYAYNVKHIYVDGDYVIFHSHATLKKGDRGNDKNGMNIIDTWRLEDGRIVEHWDSIQGLDTFMRFYSLISGGNIQNANGVF